MDGLNVKFSGSVLDTFFSTDKYGSYIPQPDLLQMDVFVDKIGRQLSSNTGLWRRMTEMNYRTDVEFTDNPEGNTPVLGAGIKLFGPRPYDRLKFRGRLREAVEPSPEMKSPTIEA